MVQTEPAPDRGPSARHGLILLVGMAICALAGVVATQVYLRLPFDPLPVVLVTASALFIYGLNRITDRDEDAHNDPRRANGVRAAAALTAISALTLGGLLGWLMLQGQRPIFYVAVLLLGLAYSIRVVPWFRRPGGFHRVRLKDLVVVKSVVVAAVWTGSLFGAPLLRVPVAFTIPAPLAFMAAGFFAAYFANVLYCDMRDVPGDRAAGVDTMPVRFGLGPCYRAIAVICGSFLAVAVAAWWQGWIDTAHLCVLLLADGAYPALIWHVRERTRLSGDRVDYAVEALVPLFALGLVALRLGDR